MTKKLLLGLGFLLFIVCVLIFRPVPIVSEENAIIEKGVVSALYEGGIKDVVFHLEGNKRKFYINRGLENGLQLNELKAQLIGEKVTFKYPKYWTPLDWNDSVKHLSKVEQDEDVIFNELKE